MFDQLYVIARKIETTYWGTERGLMTGRDGWDE